jgi:hypothetical protein
MGKCEQFIYTSTPLICISLDMEYESIIIYFYFFHKLHVTRFELKTSNFDTMLNYYSPTRSYK